MSTAAEQRQAVADLSHLAQRDLEAFFDVLGAASVTQIRDALMDVLPALFDTYGSAAALLAADWYSERREASGVRGQFQPILAPVPTGARWEALARWGTAPLLSDAPTGASPLSLVSGGLQRSIADQHRLTVVESSNADPSAQGWRRVGVGHSCGFCRMLIGRGHVYSDKSVTFKSHDHCNCAAEPEWSPNVRKIVGVPFQYSQRKAAWSDERKKRENQRVYDFIGQ